MLKLAIHRDVDSRYIWTDCLTGGTSMDLLALADFNLVARYGGFGRAARAAGRPKATLSRRVAELEAAIDAGATHLRVGSAILGSRPPHA